MKDRKSKTLGYLPGWGGYLVYEALVELKCVHCGDEIRPGEPFIRTGKGDRTNRSYPTCKECI
ncbi:hypothetical protein LCGC14_1517030 [marine sediment metagenome]|uniref:Uncharacterized protein n=1 Tax=marine sediment metagenome TaxID=412755 RepID=A0A0F9IZS2_9ZZZZ